MPLLRHSPDGTPETAAGGVKVTCLVAPRRNEREAGQSRVMSVRKITAEASSRSDVTTGLYGSVSS